MNRSTKTLFKSYSCKVLVASMAALSTIFVGSSVVRASDIEIYQDSKKMGEVTLMFLLDISLSMDNDDRGKTTRLERVQTAMTDLLVGNLAKGIAPIGGDNVIGLATLGAMKFADDTGKFTGQSGTTYGAVLVPARRLDTVVRVDGTTMTQRDLIKKRVNALQTRTNTPTARSYAEVVAYLMGKSTQGTVNKVDGWSYSAAATKDGDKYRSPSSLDQAEDIKECSGQGVYVLTDGVPNYGEFADQIVQKALNDTRFSCPYDLVGWDCINKLNERILDPDANPKNLKFKTAVIGFGSEFNNIPSYDKTKTKEENLAAIKGGSDVAQAARWGVSGEGGWYSGNSSEDIVKSVNEFLGILSMTIPSVTTGSPTIPRDALNPAVLQDDAYYQQFQPTPNTEYQLWLGNLKKYLVSNKGVLKGKGGANVIDKLGKIIDPSFDDNGNITSAVYDFWAAAISTNIAIRDANESTLGSRKFAAKGGAWSQLKLGEFNHQAQRKLLTNRDYSSSASSYSSAKLTQIGLDYLINAGSKTDPYRGHLVSLLGYNIDAENPPNSVDALLKASSLRQMGAVMHSYPILITNKGKLSYNKTTKTMGSEGREDYILFGTTQGLLHVVDAKTGAEKFAFVPNEMVEKQSDAFRTVEATSGGVSQLYYGIDGPWTLDTQYVIDSLGYSTVGDGRGGGGIQTAYGGLRMGGSSYYALDLRNIDNPKLQFQIDPVTQKVFSDKTTKTFSELQYMGQSWSKPSIAWINWGGVRKRVMFVGGGYDAGYEVDHYNQSNKKGAGVYMFDADDGSLLWWTSGNIATSTAVSTKSGVIATASTNLNYSVVSDIRTVDRNGDGLIDHIYFGDLGGQIFRVDFDNKQSIIGAVPKTPVRLLDLNASGKSPRFYDMPGFSLYNQQGEIFAVVSVGSGNRSTPLQAYTSDDASYHYDAVYNIYDKDVARRDLYSAKTLKSKDLTRSQLGEITDTNRFSNTSLVASYVAKEGWFYSFKKCTAGIEGTLNQCGDYKKQSEKVFGTPLVMNYKLYVSSFDASKPGLAGSCGAGVKGESLITTFCMPFGQCAKPLTSSRAPMGAGIHTITVGGIGGGSNAGGGGSGETEKECVGDDCIEKPKGGASSENYCISTSGRIALTITGGFGEGEKTKMCLIPQRWYESFGRQIS